MTGTARLDRLRKILVLVVAGSFFGYALAQDAGQEPSAEQDAAAETAPATDTGVEAASEEDEEEEAGGAADAEGDTAADPGIDPAFDPDIYDPELDDQTYEGDDDVFVPTEEIPADEPIPFPSDI
jgi:hypothetical protein